MFERLGIITNCFEKALESGSRLDELVLSFGREGFREVEIRDGDYLRRSPFGCLISDIEKAVPNYDPVCWRDICGQIHTGGNWQKCVRKADLHLLEEIYQFFKRTREVVYSFAMTFPWLRPVQDVAADSRCILTAAGIAYLLSPAQPRLRLVSLERIESIEHEAAIANLKRYQSVARMLSPLLTLTVENALHPALELITLALAGETPLTYDEANNYMPDGTELSSADEFRRSVTMKELASVHLKQKNELGVLARLEDGYVDLRAVLEWLHEGGYEGDLLLENKPTDQPLADAVESRNYLRRLFGRDVCP